MIRRSVITWEGACIRVSDVSGFSKKFNRYHVSIFTDSPVGILVADCLPTNAVHAWTWNYESCFPHSRVS